MVNFFKDQTSTPKPQDEPTRHFAFAELREDMINIPICTEAVENEIIIRAPRLVNCSKCHQMIDNLARAGSFAEATTIVSNAIDIETVSPEWLESKNINSIEDIPGNTIGSQEDTFYKNMIKFNFITESKEPIEDYLSKLAYIRDNL